MAEDVVIEEKPVLSQKEQFENSIDAQVKTDAHAEEADKNQKAAEGGEQEQTADLGKPHEGRKQVDLNAEQQGRFNNLYRQVKGQDRTLDKMREHNEALQARLDSLEQTNTDAVHDNTVAGIQTRIQQANEEGNFEAVPGLITEMVALETKKQMPKPIAQPVKEASLVSDNDKTLISNWQDETNTDGSFKRPWAKPGDPMFNHVQQMVGAVYDHPTFVDATLAQVLERVDQIIVAQSAKKAPVQKQAPAQAAVSRSDTSYRPGANNASLTGEEKRVAEMMLPNLKPADAYKVYASQKETS